MMIKSNSVNMIKNANESLVLKEALENKIFTKRDAADATSLTFPTVSRIIDEMEQDNVLIRNGLSAPVNGRKAAVYILNPDYAHILSVYFQYDKFFGTVASAAKEELWSFEFSLVDGDYIATLEQIITKQLLKDPLIGAAAIGVPASVVDGQIRFINHYEQLHDFHLRDHIEQRFHIKTAVERDMNALIYGLVLHKEFGQDKNLSVVIITADGPGAASMLNGHIIRGFSGFAGEAGCLPVYNDCNLQTIAENHFINADIADYTARLMLCLISLVNPEKIVLIKNDYSPQDINEVISICQKKVPESAMPVIELNEQYHMLYCEGLAALGQELIMGRDC